MQAKFSFYEVVKLRDAVGIPKELVGREAVVLGRVTDETGRWHYSVDIEGVLHNRYCEEDALESTGKVKTREELYPGDSIRVSVDPKTGEGKEVEPTDGQTENKQGRGREKS